MEQVIEISPGLTEVTIAGMEAAFAEAEVYTEAGYEVSTPISYDGSVMFTFTVDTAGRDTAVVLQ